MREPPIFLNTPARLVIAVSLIILGCEYSIMLLIDVFFHPPAKDRLPNIFWEFVDPILLAALVSPALYLLIFKPMRSQQTKIEQQFAKLRYKDQLTTLIEAIPDSIFLKDGEGRWLITNEPAKQMFQLHNLSWQGKTEMELADMHPAFRAAHEECLIGDENAWQARQLVVGEESFVAENGQLSIIETRKVPIFTEDGHRKELLVIGRDITKRRLAEEKLRLNAMLFDISQNAIVITDEKNVITDVNPAFTRITGYERGEVLGKNPKLLNSGLHDQAFFDSMWQSLRQKNNWSGEMWNRRKSGGIYPSLFSISDIRDSDGRVLHYVGVFTDISHLKEREAELNHVAHFDSLTGIPNRVLLADRMKQSIAQTAREQNMMAICYLDLDGFKPINDSMGHEAGDEVLIEIAQRISNTIRGADTVARLGGDEFVALLLGLEKGEECVSTLARLLAAIAEPITVKDKTVSVSASIGVSIYPLDNEDPDTLLRHADQAMYVAKQSGKNRYHIYDTELDRLAREQHTLLKSIHHALEHHQFELHYQPKVDLRTQRLVGAEALIRWRHPERGLLLPAEFLHHVDNTDLDIEIGEWVTKTALAQMDAWRKSGLDLKVSINISGYHLETVGFLDGLQQQLAAYPDLPHGQLQIEVLETVALNDIADVRGIIESCRNIGVGFALDDFGTGYSSLSYLRNLPVDTLKIDQSFVLNMLRDKGDMSIVQGIIALAGAFSCQTVAEGVETVEHYQTLLGMGCDLGQGYHIAHPMPAAMLTNWQMGQVTSTATA